MTEPFHAHLSTAMTRANLRPIDIARPLDVSTAAVRLWRGGKMLPHGACW